jgi:hypothetical protein
MSVADRIGRSLFVALAVGLAWGMRGDFGHLVGAMYPGAVLAMALAYVSGQRSLFLWMPVIAGVSALAIGAGGTMSYGILHGYAQSDTFINGRSGPGRTGRSPDGGPRGDPGSLVAHHHDDLGRNRENADRSSDDFRVDDGLQSFPNIRFVRPCQLLDDFPVPEEDQVRPDLYTE